MNFIKAYCEGFVVEFINDCKQIVWQVGNGLIFKSGPNQLRKKLSLFLKSRQLQMLTKLHITCIDSAFPGKGILAKCQIVYTSGVSIFIWSIFQTGRVLILKKNNSDLIYSSRKTRKSKLILEVLQILNCTKPGKTPSSHPGRLLSVFYLHWPESY